MQDLEPIIAIDKTGTFSAAARLLKTTHTTIARKIRNLETHYGTQLIKRDGDRLSLTIEGEKLLHTALEINDRLMLLERDIAGVDNKLDGKITLTTVDILAWQHMSIFAKFTQKYPNIELNIETDAQVKLLSRREAEVALRLTNSPEEYLYGRIVGKFEFSPYINRQTFEECGAPQDLNQLVWMNYNGQDCASLSNKWMKKHNISAPISARISTPLMMLKAVEQGMGVGFLPSVIADENQHLMRLSHEIAFELNIWLLAPMELKNTARIGAIFEAFK
ncbi:MAG: LysR family transcriptional regulator [Hyphomicrobiales bacterium]